MVVNRILVWRIVHHDIGPSRNGICLAKCIIPNDIVVLIPHIVGKCIAIIVGELDAIMIKKAFEICNDRCAIGYGTAVNCFSSVAVHVLYCMNNDVLRLADAVDIHVGIAIDGAIFSKLILERVVVESRFSLIVLKCFIRIRVGHFIKDFEYIIPESCSGCSKLHLGILVVVFYCIDLNRKLFSNIVNINIGPSADCVVFSKLIDIALCQAILIIGFLYLLIFFPSSGLRQRKRLNEIQYFRTDSCLCAGNLYTGRVIKILNGIYFYGRQIAGDRMERNYRAIFRQNITDIDIKVLLISNTTFVHLVGIPAGDFLISRYAGQVGEGDLSLVIDVIFPVEPAHSTGAGDAAGVSGAAYTFIGNVDIIVLIIRSCERFSIFIICY